MHSLPIGWWSVNKSIMKRLFLTSSKNYLVVLLVGFICIPAWHTQAQMNPNTANFYGTVSDTTDGIGIGNLTVTAYGSDTVFTETNENGQYQLVLNPGNYDVHFEFLGMQTKIVTDTNAADGMMTEISVALCEEPYPVAWVHAEPNEADTEILVTWGNPEGPYEVIYDDGNANDHFMWAMAVFRLVPIFSGTILR